MKGQILGYLDQHLFAQEDLQNFLRALCLDRQRIKNGRETWDRQPGALEFALDDLFRLRLFGRQRDFASGEANDIACNGESAGPDCILQGRVEKVGVGISRTAAQLLLRNSRCQRIRAMKLIDGFAKGHRALLNQFESSDLERLLAQYSNAFLRSKFFRRGENFRFHPPCTADYFGERERLRPSFGERSQNPLM